jgi:hypothetical protein
MSLKGIKLTEAGTWPNNIEARFHSYGDISGLFVETHDALTEDHHPTGGDSYANIEFAKIDGSKHGDVIATSESALGANWPQFGIKLPDVSGVHYLGIVSPFAGMASCPGKLDVFVYDAATGIPTLTPTTTIAFAAIAGVYCSVIVSLAKIGTNYHAIHRCYTAGVPYSVASKLEYYGVIHAADGSIISSWKIDDCLEYTPLKVPYTYLLNYGNATKNGWIVRIGVASPEIEWNWIEWEVSSLNGGGNSNVVTKLNIGGIDYYVADVADWGIDSYSPTIRFRFAYEGVTPVFSGWSDYYTFGADSILLNESSDAVPCYIERHSYATGHGEYLKVCTDDVNSDAVSIDLASDSAFTSIVMTGWYWAGIPGVFYTTPFSKTYYNGWAFVPIAVTTAYMRARAQAVGAGYSDYSATISLTMNDTVASISNCELGYTEEWQAFDADTIVHEPYFDDYEVVNVDDFSIEAVQGGGQPRAQHRNTANADTAFTLFRHRDSVYIGGYLDSETIEDFLLALDTSGIIKKVFTYDPYDPASAFYATNEMSGENGVSYLSSGGGYPYGPQYHRTFDDASPIDLIFPWATMTWMVIMKLKGTLCAVVDYLYGGSGIHYKPLDAVTDWTLIADTEQADMKHVSIDPWGESLYYADYESGLVVSYVVPAWTPPVGYCQVPWEGRVQLNLVKEVV